MRASRRPARRGPRPRRGTTQAVHDVRVGRRSGRDPDGARPGGPGGHPAMEFEPAGSHRDGRRASSPAGPGRPEGLLDPASDRPSGVGDRVPPGPRRPPRRATRPRSDVDRRGPGARSRRATPAREADGQQKYLPRAALAAYRKPAHAVNLMTSEPSGRPVFQAESCPLCRSPHRRSPSPGNGSAGGLWSPGSSSPWCWARGPRPLVTPEVVAGPMTATIRAILPDGSVARAPCRAARAATRGRDRAGPGAGSGRHPGRRRRARPDAAASRRSRRVAILTERDPDALPVLRHSAAHVLATAVRELFPGAGIGFGPADRGRLLLRLRSAAALHPRGPRGDRGPDGARWCAADYPFVREEVDSRDEANAPLRRRPAQARADQRAGRRRDHLDLYRRPLHRPLPRAAHARHRPAEALQAADHGRGVLARRREAPDAAAHLRHRLVQEGRPRRRTSTGSRRPGSATTGGSARSWTSSCSIPGRPARRSGRSGAPSIYNAVNEYMRELQRDGYKEIKTPLLYNRRLWELSRALGQVPREHVPGARQRDRRARLLAQADELPLALPAVRLEEAQLPRAAAPLLAPTTCCTGTRSAARSRD